MVRAFAYAFRRLKHHPIRGHSPMKNRHLWLWRRTLSFISLRALAIGLQLGLAPYVLAGLPAGAPAAADSTSASLAEMMPSGAIGYAEARSLGQLLERIRTSSYLEMAMETPQVQGLQKTPQYRKGDAVRKIVESQLGMDL